MIRFSQHKSCCHSSSPANPKLANCWKKYGDPEIIVMGTYEEEQHMIEAEQFYLNVSIEDPDCLNLNPFADRGPSQKGKKKSPEARANMSAAHRGKKRSSETKDKISAALTGIKRSPEWKVKMKSANANPIIAVDPQGNETHYSSASECARQTKFSQQTISNLVLLGKPAKYGRCKGWSFRSNR